MIEKKNILYHVPHWAPLNRTLELVRPLDGLTSFGASWIRIGEGYIVQLQSKYFTFTVFVQTKEQILTFTGKLFQKFTSPPTIKCDDPVVCYFVTHE